MKVWVYLDESGSIHKNSQTHYFAIGGYFVYGDNFAQARIINRYKKINKRHKNKRNMDVSSELKTRNMQIEEKIELISAIQKLDYFIGCSVVFDKTLMKKAIEKSTLFFNYGVKILFKDIILPLLDNHEQIEFIISVDNQNISVGKLNGLEMFLNTEFCYEDYTFCVNYYDSATHYGIQLADLIVNTMYLKMKTPLYIEPLLKQLDPSKFCLSIFPGKKYYGRTKKINTTCLSK